MNLTNYYWFFQSAIPSRICDDIVKYGHQLQDQMAVTGGYGNRKLNKKEIKDGYTKKYNHILIKQIKAQVGILNGIGLSLVNLQNIKKDSIMIGIVIVGINLT